MDGYHIQFNIETLNTAHKTHRE